MNRREQLMENYNDALFALLMDELAVQEGNELLSENERLENDPRAAVPDSIDKRSFQTIRRAFSRENRHTAAVVGRKVFTRVAMAAVLAAALFLSAYAAFPEVRVGTLNLLIERSDVATKLTLYESLPGQTPRPEPQYEPERETIAGYIMPRVPLGFKVVDKEENSRGAWLMYSDGSAASVKVVINKVTSTSVDIENPDSSDNITVNGYEGMIIEKNDIVYIAWADTDEGSYIKLQCENISRELALSMAEDIIAEN